MTFTDTHCHIHEESYAESEKAYREALAKGVTRLICVGTDEVTSKEAAEFASGHDNAWFSVGLHPHDAKNGVSAVHDLEALIKKDKSVHVNKVVAVGECGLDYFYDNSPRSEQVAMFEAQLDLASRYDLPMIFHVRSGKTGDVFTDFWPIVANFPGVKGVLHSFTDTKANLERGLERGLYVGVNGISTFTKDEAQLDMFRAIPLNRLLFETDAPFLTPAPHRGKINEPAFVMHVAQYYANLRSINLEELSRATEQNATSLFFNTNN
jgi:TatD DNase family protein